jgi:hypothetical protein
LSAEPRLGLRWQLKEGQFFIAGMGLHSRQESFPVYYSLIKNSLGVKEPLNKNLDFSKSIHYIAGFDFLLEKDLHLKLEVYYQHLINIPIVNSTSSRYSSINSSERLPEAILENKGLGFNKGIELTLEKAFTNYYYFLITGSLFNSMFRAGDKAWYNTYYNTTFVSNILAGKEFPVGKDGRNRIGLNIKYLIRGGYRYTPVDFALSMKSKKIIYDASKTYEQQLPEFIRLDGGISFRKNNPHYSWIILADIQNMTNRRNVFRKKFNYENGIIVTSNVLSLGVVPVLNFRIEF